jgi:hypothetical protein
MLATLAAAWTPGRIAVRFDDDVAQALMDTQMEASIPTEVLNASRRGGSTSTARASERGRGSSVTLDAGTVTGPGGQGYTELDELLVGVVRGGDDGPPLVISSLWLRPAATIGDRWPNGPPRRSVWGQTSGRRPPRTGWRP